jgi:hypothetical protein
VLARWLASPPAWVARAAGLLGLPGAAQPGTPPAARHLAPDPAPPTRPPPHRGPQVGSTADEWRQLAEAAAALGEEGGDLAAALGHVPAALLLEYVPGATLAGARGAFQVRRALCAPLCVPAAPAGPRARGPRPSCPRLARSLPTRPGPRPRLARSLPTRPGPRPPPQGAGARAAAADLGRLFLLDMLLGNADRLPCRQLGWRGNGGNVLFGGAGGRYAGRVVAIDSAVQRRPPAALRSAEDERTERLAALLLHSREEAARVLREVRGSSGGGGGGGGWSLRPGACGWGHWAAGCALRAPRACGCCSEW